MTLNNCQYLGLYLVLKTLKGLLNVYKRLQCLLGRLVRDSCSFQACQGESVKYQTWIGL